MDRRPLPVRAPAHRRRAPERYSGARPRGCELRRVVLRRTPGFRLGACVRAMRSVLRAPGFSILVMGVRTRVVGRCTIAVVHAELAELWAEKLYACGLTATVEQA